MRNAEYLTKLVFDYGAALFGVADLSRIDKSDFLIEKRIVENLKYGISIAIGVSKMVLLTIKDHPTKIYFHHYRQLNNALDQLALKISSYIQSQGFNALPIPASQVIDWQNQRGHLSHKKIAEVAGLGWIGRNNLLVNEKYGSQIRLVTILTDLPLKNSNQNSKVNCGACFKCLPVCPVGAIKERKEDFDHIKCFELLKDFQKKGYVSQYICGICVRACEGTEER